MERLKLDGEFWRYGRYILVYRVMEGTNVPSMSVCHSIMYYELLVM